jgi:hypothetical protein
LKRFVGAMFICTIVEALKIAAPGAEWTLNGNDYSGLIWIDNTQAKPTRTELLTALDTCNTQEALRAEQQAAARFAVRLSTATQAQKVNAIILLLDLDK